MTGKQDRNLRSGHLSENVALEFLRQFAFVAPTPNHDDIGIDGVATLFRRDGRVLTPEESFLVQVKARTFEKECYEGEGLDFLRNLQLPFFFLHANLRDLKFSLYSTASASRNVNFTTAQKITFHLEESTIPALDGDHSHLQTTFGEPMMTWSPQEALNEEFQNKAYSLLKSWLRVENEAILDLRLGVQRPIVWKSNEPPKLQGHHFIRQHESEFKERLESLKTNFDWLVMQSGFPDAKKSDVIWATYFLKRFMRRNSVMVDPNGIVECYLKLLEKDQI